MVFKRIRVLMWVFLSLALSFGNALDAQSTSAQTDKATQTRESWDEMMHYALIGRWDLAQGYGQALLQSDPDPVVMLDLAQSERYANSYKTLALMQTNTPLKGIAEGVLKLVEEGRFRQRTDVGRIADEVKRLSGTTRGRMLAINRLKDSGEWAIPVMIEALRNPDRSDEYTYIRWALPQIGKSAVAPLVVVLQKSSDLNIRLIVLETLSKIGYKSTLPQIQQIIESEQASTELKTASVKAFQTIDPGSPTISAARRFENLAEAYYNQVSSLKVAANQSFATIWFWDDSEGLSWENVPRGAFDELMAMRSCETAVKLDPTLSTAVSLWLSAFFRLESEGYSYPAYFQQNHADADTYALTAGPEYIIPVLSRALKNRNQPLALASIHVLQRNSGQQALLQALGDRQPLITALTFPDRQVRFSAALAIAGALPSKSFHQHDMVVPILAETIRQEGQSFAMVVDKNQQRRNRLVAELRDSGLFSDVVSNENFAIAVGQAKSLPSVDLIVLAEDIDQPSLSVSLELAKGDYRLAFCPIVILSTPRTLPATRRLKGNDTFVDVLLDPISIEGIIKKHKEIMDRNHATAFDQEVADRYALQADQVLRQLAMTNNEILPVGPSEAALIQVCFQDRKEIQIAAIQTLARVDSLKAQRTIASLALDSQRDIPTRLLALRHLAVSAKAFGNLLLSEQVNGLLDIISSRQQEKQLRNLAAEAYGSLNLPSAEISNLITDQTRIQLP